VTAGPALLAALVAALPAIQARGQQQEQHAPAGWPCVGTPDRAYFDIAEATGGQVFLFHPSEIADSSLLTLGGMRHPQTIARIAGSLVEGVHTFTIPMDSTVESALFSISLQCLQVVEIAAPSGARPRNGDPGVDDHAFEAGRIVTIDRPEPGPWQITVSGRGMFFLVVQARSPIGLNAVVLGDPRAGGGRPILKIGVPVHVEVTVSGDAQRPAFEIVGAQGNNATPLPLATRENGDGSALTYFGQLTPTLRRFRIALRGTDSHGFPFERVHAPLYSTAGPE
jgi:hypothetical protein